MTFSCGIKTVRLFDQNISPQLRPLLRAFVLGYASSTVPRLFTIFIKLLSMKYKMQEAHESEYDAKAAALGILRGALGFQRFPFFCAALAGGSTFLNVPVQLLLSNLPCQISKRIQLRLSRWISAFVAAELGIMLLQSRESEAFVEKPLPNTYSPFGVALKEVKFAGRTMDLTLFAVSRAVDVVVGELWARRRARKLSSKSWTRVDSFISNISDPAVFAGSCALVMWAWVYLPERLPRAYNNWITSASGVDMRLLEALRRASWGEFLYGQDTGQAPLLTTMCRDHGWPEIWGDPSKTVPIPCEMVHMGTGKSCELHAISRFGKGFLFACGIYMPLNIALQLRRPMKASWKKWFLSCIRSSAFLGTFISLFYYGVCLARSRVGPKILGTSLKARQRIDSGICIASGCMLCGWSILLENVSRRKDIALFVTPRALATILPRRYELKYQMRENIVFATSVATVFTCVQENPSRVRGVFGRLLKSVLAA